MVFILDSSGSVQVSDSRGWDKMKQFVVDVIGYFDIGQIQVGVIVFSHNVQIQIRLNQYKNRADLVRGVRALRYIGSKTNTPEALRILYSEAFQRNQGARDSVVKIAILLTDGVPNMRSEEMSHVRDMIEQTKNRAEEARKRGISIFTIGIGLSRRGTPVYVRYGSETLRVIASSPSQTYIFQVAEFGGLSGISRTIFTRMSTIYRQTGTTRKKRGESCMAEANITHILQQCMAH